MAAITQLLGDMVPVTIQAPDSESSGIPDRNQNALSGSSLSKYLLSIWSLYYILNAILGSMVMNKSGQNPRPHCSGGETINQQT